MVEDTMHPALEDVPVILDVLRMDTTFSHILNLVIDDLVREMPAHTPVSRMRV